MSSLLLISVKKIATCVDSIQLPRTLKAMGLTTVTVIVVSRDNSNVRLDMASSIGLAIK